MEYVLSKIIENPDECPIMHELGYLIYRIHKIGSDRDKDNYIGDTNELLKERMFNPLWGHLNFDAPWATKKLRNAILEYGTDNFTLEIIYKGEYIDWLEEYYITMHDSYEHGYNQNRSGKGTGGMTGERLRMILSERTPEQRSEIGRKSAKTRAERGNHSWQTLTPEQMSDRSRKAMATMGPEGLSAKAKKGAETLGKEGRSNRARKSANTRAKEGTHPFQNLTPKQLSERTKKGNETLGPEGRSARAKKVTETNRRNGTGIFGLTPEHRAKQAASITTDYVFYNPSENEYKIHVANWTSRFKHGYSERLCKLLDWLTYCSTHDLDPDLINYKEYLDKD